MCRGPSVSVSVSVSYLPPAALAEQVPDVSWILEHHLGRISHRRVQVMQAESDTKWPKAITVAFAAADQRPSATTCLLKECVCVGRCRGL